MLEIFFTSKVRVKILRLFLLSPIEKFHVREITRQIDEEINAVRRELSRLYKIRLFGREKRGNRVYYFLKPNFIFYPEFFKMIIKEFGLALELKKKAEETARLKYVGVAYEWYANRERPHTEVDLLLIGEMSLKVLSEMIAKHEARMQKEINYTLLSEAEFEEMKRLNSPFLSKFFKQEIIVLWGDREKFLGK